jgi:hypothetical protein
MEKLEWIDDGYTETEWVRKEFRDGVYAIEYNREYITAFCGGVFLCDFSYNYALDRATYLARSLDDVPDDVKLFFKKFYVACMEDIAKDYSNENRYNLRATWWEIDRRAMYWAGKLYGVKVGRDVVNPNSGNTAGQFTTTLNKRRIQAYRKETGQ